MIESINIYDVVMEIVGALLLWNVWDWVDAIVKVGVIDIMVTWFSFFVGMTIKSKIKNTDISYMKYQDLNLFGYIVFKIIKFAGKVLEWIFVYLIDARCNRSILLNIILLDKPARFNELVTDRAKRYRLFADDHKTDEELLQTDGLVSIASSTLNFRHKWQYDFGVWLCTQMERVDEGHCDDN